MKLSYFYTVALPFASSGIARAAPARRADLTEIERRYAEIQSLEARQGPLSVIEIISGIHVAIAAGRTITSATDIAGNIANAFKPSSLDKHPYENTNNCRLYYTTKSSGNCYAESTIRSDATSTE